jgi:hypothetical protein
MKRIALALALVAAFPVLANTALFTRYESVRQSFLKNSLKDVQTNAAALAADARKAKLASIAKEADAVAKSADLNKARAAFAPLSDAMIVLRNGTKGAKPAVYGCSMLKKSWLQPKGQAGNPFDPAMAMCGELKAE